MPKVRVDVLGDASSFNRAMKGAVGHAGAFHRTVVAASAAVGTALVALGVAAKIGFSEFSQQARVGAQTNAVIKSTGGLANVTRGHIERLATALMKLSGTDDEAVQAGENMLLTFRNIRNESGKGNNIFDQSTKALLDMATAMNGGVTPSSEELNKTAIRLGKALNDPLKGMTALGRVGVQFTMGQKEQIKVLLDTGKTAKEVAAAQEKAAGDVEKAHADVISASEKLKTAEDNASNASYNLKTAQEGLRDAQQDAQDAQKALTQARKDAKRAVDDLKDSLRDAKNSEEGASIALKRAQENLQKVMADSTSTDLDKREAILGVKEAESSLHEAQEKRKETQKELNKRTKEGVDRSPEVIAANKGIADANKSVADASHNAATASGDLNDAQHELSVAQAEARGASEKLASAHTALEKAQHLLVGKSPSLENRMKAQKIILAELNKEFGGSAEAAGKTLPGQLNVLKESMREVAASIVGEAAPAMADFSEFAKTKGLPAIQKFAKGFTNVLGPAIGRTSKAFVGFMRNLGPVLKGTGDGFKKFKPMFTALADIAAKTMQAVGKVIKEHGDDIREIFKNLGTVIQNLSKVVLPVLAFFFQKVLPVALKVAIPLLKLLSESIVILSEIIAAVLGPLVKLATAIGSVLVGAVSAGVDLISGLGSGITAGWSAIATWFTNLPGTIIGFFSGCVTWLSEKGANIISGLLGSAAGGIKGAWVAVSEWFRNRKGILLAFFTGGLSWLAPKGYDLIKGLLGDAAGGIKGGWATVTAWFATLPGAVQGYFIDAASWLVTAGVNIVGGLVKGIESVAGKIKKALLKPIRWVVDKWNDLKIPRVEINTHIPGVGKVGIGPYNLPDIKGLYAGGIVTRPTLAMIGERGPEAVIPLGKNVGGNTFITVPLSMVGASPQEAARLIWVELLKLKTTGEKPSLGLA